MNKQIHAIKKKYVAPVVRVHNDQQPDLNLKTNILSVSNIYSDAQEVGVLNTSENGIQGDSKPRGDFEGRSENIWHDLW